MSEHSYGEISWERMIGGVEKARQRLLRATAALEQGGVPYAVAGAHAVAEWISRVDPAATRNTSEADILVPRICEERAREVLLAAGFQQPTAEGELLFFADDATRKRDAVKITFASERRHSGDAYAMPDVTDSEGSADFRVLSLQATVAFSLIRYRVTDRVDLRDLIEVELMDTSWPQRFPAELGARLQQLLDDPDG